MTDPWEQAAERISTARVEAEQSRRAQAEQDQQERDRERAERQREWDATNAAIDAAVPLLEAFLAKRGAAAQKLMAACGEEQYVRFGTDSDGSYYGTVYFDGHGVRKQSGVTSSQGGGSHSEPRPASVREAVEYFARYGDARGDLSKVATIATWFEAQINSRASRAAD